MGSKVLTMNTKTIIVVLISYLSHVEPGQFFLVKNPERAWVVQMKKGNTSKTFKDGGGSPKFLAKETKDNSTNHRKGNHSRYSMNDYILAQKDDCTGGVLKVEDSSKSHEFTKTVPKISEQKILNLNVHQTRGIFWRRVMMEGCGCFLIYEGPHRQGKAYYVTRTGEHNLPFKQIGSVFKEDCSKIGQRNPGIKIPGLEYSSFDAIWSDEQCDNIGSGAKSDKLEDCLNTCKNNDDCTAVNFGGTDCVLRKCGIPVPWPGWVYNVKYKGYSLERMDLPWYFGACAEKGTRVSPYLGNELRSKEECLDFCQIFGRTACTWDEDTYHCNAWLSDIKDPRIDSKDEITKCFKFDDTSELVCAEPKFGFVLKNLKLKKDFDKQKTAKDSSECLQHCIDMNNCNFWSFEGCVEKDRAVCDTKKLMCNLWTTSVYTNLQQEASDNIDAAWGDRRSCKKGCRLYQAGVILYLGDEEEDRIEVTEVNDVDINDKIKSCRKKCRDCIHFHTINDKCVTVYNNHKGRIIQPLETRNTKYSREECHQLCRNTDNCLQWDWRKNYIFAIQDSVSVCRMVSMINKVNIRKVGRLESFVGTRYSCVTPGDENEKNWYKWHNGKCRPWEINAVPLGPNHSQESCKEYCKIHGLTGCDWTPPDQSKELKSNCSAVLEGFGTHYMLPSDDGTQCYPLYSANRECAYPKFGYVASSSYFWSTKKVKNNWECNEYCKYTEQCRFWSFDGCILGVMGEEKERCHIENKYDCKLYSELDISRMKIKASSNLHASWGTQWTCENEVCKPYDYGQIVKDEHKADATYDNAPNREFCIQKCKEGITGPQGIDVPESQSCIYFYFDETQKRCYFVESKASGVLPITDNFNDLPSGPEECHILCKKSKDCLQWDWRVQKLNIVRYNEDGDPVEFFIWISVCMRMKEMNEVKKSFTGKSAVGTKYSCQKSQAQWSNGKCLGDDNTPLDEAAIPGFFTLYQCAELCSQDPQTKACGYNHFDSRCIAHKEIVKSASTSDEDKIHNRCAIIIPKVECKCGVDRTRTRQTRSIGDPVTPVDKYPWMVRLVHEFEYHNGFQYGNSPQCGGVLIASRWVLTAAHCIDGQKKPNGKNNHLIQVVLGEHNWKKKKRTDMWRNLNDKDSFSRKFIIVQRWFLHKEWKKRNFKLRFDVALVYLDEEVDLSIYTPVCLPQSSVNFSGKRALAYGWGRKARCDDDSNEELHEVEHTIISNPICEQAKGEYLKYDPYAASFFQRCTKKDGTYAGKIFDEMICAEPVKKGKGLCKGDSGGPLTVKSSTGHHTLAGIISWGLDCGNVRFPGVFVNVANQKILNWIHAKIQDYGGAVWCKSDT